MAEAYFFISLNLESHGDKLVWYNERKNKSGVAVRKRSLNHTATSLCGIINKRVGLPWQVASFENCNYYIHRRLVQVNFLGEV